MRDGEIEGCDSGVGSVGEWEGRRGWMRCGFSLVIGGIGDRRILQRDCSVIVE